MRGGMAPPAGRARRPGRESVRLETRHKSGVSALVVCAGFRPFCGRVSIYSELLVGLCADLDPLRLPPDRDELVVILLQRRRTGRGHEIDERHDIADELALELDRDRMLLRLCHGRRDRDRPRPLRQPAARAPAPRRVARRGGGRFLDARGQPAGRGLLSVRPAAGSPCARPGPRRRRQLRCAGACRASRGGSTRSSSPSLRRGTAPARSAGWTALER